MSNKEEFMKLKTPEELLEFMKKHKDIRYDTDMARHFNTVAKKHSSGETPENHTDPKAAFLKRERGD